MSEDGFSDGFEEPNIEIQIKTLMGTTFDIKVSLHDTVSTIKKKIFRVEGIPVHQQNLIFRSQELKDSARLCDTGIKNGSTITLVSAMRGGPISTRRLSLSCEHYLLKELKDLLENSRDEMSPGSKVSVLVFKEGDIINLLRVIENEDGSYSPYNEGPISPPSKPSRRDTIEAFERLVEDTVMCTKVALLRKKLDQLNVKRQTRNTNANDSDRNGGEKLDRNTLKDEKSKNISYQLLEGPAGQLVDVDLTIFENNSDEGNQSESEEIALKDKHRTKPKVLQNITVPKSKSLYSERKGSYSHTRHNYAKIAKRREARLFEKSEVSPDGCITFSRDRIVGHGDASNCLENTLPTLSGLDDRLGGSGILPSLDDLESPSMSRLPTVDTGSENPYLLQGLSSNKLPDLRISETDDFLHGDSNDKILGNSTRSNQQNPNNNSLEQTFLNVPLSSYLEGNAPRTGTTAKILPDLANRIAQRNFGPLVPDVSTNSPNVLDGGSANSAPLLDSLPLASAYTITRNMAPSHTLETSFCNMDLPNNKLPRSSYSLSNTNKMSQQSPSLDSPLSNLTRLEPLANLSGSRGESPILGATGGPSVEEVGTQLAEQLQLFDDESNGDVYGESYSVSRNRVHLTRLVLASEGAERPKSSPDSIELEEHTQDLWEIHEPASERLKRSATCKVGLLKRRQGVEYNYDSLENPQSNLKPELSNMGNYSQSSAEFGVCSGANFYMPQYLSAPSAIPPQYAPKHHPKYCDLFFTNEPRSPLYNRRNRRENLEANKSNKTSSNVNDDDCSNIERLKNDDQLFGSKTEFSNDDLFGYCNLGCATDLVERLEESKEVIKLPPVIKKKSRCNECNKRLNITNIYNCRCGRIFCSQHRYSEAHRCTYDYKTEGKKILERQNPLVTAQKVQRF